MKFVKFRENVGTFCSFQCHSLIAYIVFCSKDIRREVAKSSKKSKIFDMQFHI